MTDTHLFLYYRFTDNYPGIKSQFSVPENVNSVRNTLYLLSQVLSHYLDGLPTVYYAQNAFMHAMSGHWHLSFVLTHPFDG